MADFKNANNLSAILLFFKPLMYNKLELHLFSSNSYTLTTFYATLFKIH